jgi:hypothetical protein
MTQNFIEQKNQYALALEQVKAAQKPQVNESNLLETIGELESDLNSMDEDEAIEKIKNWIESV